MHRDGDFANVDSLKAGGGQNVGQRAAFRQREGTRHACGWNRGAELMYGYTAAEIVGRSVSLLVPPGYPDEIGGILAKIKGGELVRTLSRATRDKRDQLAVKFCFAHEQPGGNRHAHPAVF